MEYQLSTNSVFEMDVFLDVKQSAARISVLSHTKVIDVVRKFLKQRSIAFELENIAIYQITPDKTIIWHNKEHIIGDLEYQTNLRLFIRPLKWHTTVKHYLGCELSIPILIKCPVKSIIQCLSQQFDEVVGDFVLVFRRRQLEPIVCTASLSLIEHGWNGEKLYFLNKSKIHIGKASKLGISLKSPLKKGQLLLSRFVAYRFRTEGAFISLSKLGILIEGSSSSFIPARKIQKCSLDLNAVLIETNEQKYQFPVSERRRFKATFDEIFNTQRHYKHSFDDPKHFYSVFFSLLLFLFTLHFLIEK